ncbi:MAG: hypothetical protein J07HQW2_00211 [Haloquadratum walsbyi J07HQW2]|uniref:Uncharacterized protein n=1 Tax=Haloquadratum walsbyi J07HQW2 TaxID=1238425 RepID=U1PJD8_9EURY|nr:MAG: hypothetical protein J07HQW2_00211 [Haloquadratum walsbyi J07HQW2]
MQGIVHEVQFIIPHGDWIEARADATQTPDKEYV